MKKVNKAKRKIKKSVNKEERSAPSISVLKGFCWIIWYIPLYLSLECGLLPEDLVYYHCFYATLLLLLFYFFIFFNRHQILGLQMIK